mgnify:CR=1 FL=1
MPGKVALPAGLVALGTTLIALGWLRGLALNRPAPWVGIWQERLRSGCGMNERSEFFEILSEQGLDGADLGRTCLRPHQGAADE